VSLLLPLPLVITANAAVGRPWAHHAIGILAGIASGATFLLGALDLAGAGTTSSASGGQASLPVDVGIMVTAVIAAALVVKPVRERVARYLPIDPDNPVHALALVLTVLLLGMQALVIFFTNFASTTQSALTLADLFTQEIPFLILALFGVGIFMRRDAAQAASRLGLVVPAWWQVLLAIAAAPAFFGLGLALHGLGQVVTPDTTRQIDATSHHLFDPLSGPVGVAAVALVPGICEEILFRGALQPRIGLVLTALLFASIHTQYGLSFDALSVFVIAIGLGLIRKYTNTTTSAISHITYNLIVGAITYSQINSAVTVETALILLAAFAIWASRRRPVQNAGS
jgi:membrane protease YdiL (CAAX protease family)